MMVTGWRLPPAAAEPGGEQRASGLDANLVVVHADPARAGRLFDLLVRCLFGAADPAPGEVTVWDGSSSRALRPGDRPPAPGGTIAAARQSDARRGWAMLAGRTPASAALVRERADLVAAATEVAAMLSRWAEHEKAASSASSAGAAPAGHSANGRAVTNGSNARSGGQVDARLAAIDAADHSLATLDEEAALATRRLSEVAAELQRHAGAPNRDELNRDLDQLDQLDAAVVAAAEAEDEAIAAERTISVMKRALAEVERPVERIRGPILQLLAMVVAMALIIATVVLLLVSQAAPAAATGAAALAAAIISLLAPVRRAPVAPPVLLPSAEELRAQRRRAEERLARERVRLREATKTKAALGAALELVDPTDAGGRAVRRDELSAALAARRHSEKLANTAEGALVDLEAARAAARLRALQHAAARAGRSEPPDLNLHLADPDPGEAAARHRFLGQRLALTHRLLAGTLAEIDQRHPQLLNDAAALVHAVTGCAIEGVDAGGLRFASGGVATAQAGTAQAGPGAVFSTDCDAHADLCLAVAAARLGAGGRAVPLVLGAVTIPGAGTVAGDREGDAAARVVAALAAEAAARQVIVITSDAATYGRLVEGGGDVTAVELTSIRVLVTPSE